MILQALNDYYERLRADPEIEVSDFGFSQDFIDCVITISMYGELKDVMPLEDPKKSICPSPSVSLQDLENEEFPLKYKRTSGIATYFLCDKGEYVVDNKQSKKHNEFKLLSFLIINGSEEVGLRAILSFLEHSKENSQEILKLDPNIFSRRKVGFRLDKELKLIHEKDEAIKLWKQFLQSIPGKKLGNCLIKNEKAPILPVHPPIRNKQRSFATSKGELSIVSFNIECAESYGRSQSFNAPICEQAAFAYTTALNTLLDSESRRKMQIGDITLVFWTDVPSAAEEFFGLAVGGKEAEDQQMALEIEQYLKAIVKGHYPHELGKRDTVFYVLGLSPNSSRLSTRFWYKGTVGKLSENIGNHYRALRLHRSNFENMPEYPRPRILLRELAPQRDFRHIPSLLAGQFLRAIVHNQPYPRTLLSTVMTRIRADRWINYLRACLVKAYLTRNLHKEIAMSLDKDNTDIGYRLGRLFAIVEHIQNNAVPGANATVRDRFFGAAAATPRRIFPVILKNAQHGLAKIRKEKPGWAITLDKSLQEILDSVKPQNGFPATMSLEEQGMFVLGYYHQRQDLYTKQEDKTEE